MILSATSTKELNTLSNDVAFPLSWKVKLENYLSMMMCICSIFLRMINTVDAEDERDAIWRYLKENNSNVYRRVRHSVLNMGTNLPTNLGRKIGITGYHVAQRIFKFN